MVDDELTSEGTRLVKAWLGAQDEVERAKSRLRSAECDLANTQKALAKWMLPEDAKPGEKIAVWYVDSLIQVEVPLQGHMTIPVTIRKRGRSLHAR
jgi:hypothetical protein